MFFTLSDISNYKVKSNYGAIVAHGTCEESRDGNSRPTDALESAINETKEKMFIEAKSRKGNAIINYKVLVQQMAYGRVLFTLSGDVVFLQESFGNGF